MSSKTAVYKNFTVNVEEGQTVEEVKAALTEIFPELANASVNENESGVITFEIKAGEKGR